MRVKINWLFIASSILVLSTVSDARKIRVRPRPVENDEETAADTRGARIQYYAAQDPQEEQPNVVLVSADDYNGYYGQPSQTASARVVQDNYVPQSRASNSRPKQQETLIRQKETPKAPPVQTIRNYNKVNDDGSFTFGYEAADGSFKEETRGTDCVVRGKYGYVDPDGNKREFTYVSGNPCDPNAAPEDSDERREGGKSQEQEEADDGVANYPKAFPVRPASSRPTPAPRPTQPPARAPVTTVFQNVYNQDAEEDEEDEAEPLQVLRPQTPRPRVIQPQPRPQYVQQPYQLPRLEHSTQNSLLYQSSNSPVTITPRPTTPKAQLPATTYRPQLVAVTPRPQLYTTEDQPHRYFPSSTPSPITRTPQGGIDFAAEFQKFAQENVIQSTPKTLAKTTEKGGKPFQGSEPIYSSELVYDPSSGQYKTQLYQTLPQTTGDFTLNHRIQPYVAPQHAPQQRLVSLQQLQQQSPLYRTVQQQPQPRPSNQQLYQQQQSEIQFQNSQQLFAQQQRARAQTQQPAPRPAALQAQQGPQQFYYVQQPHEGAPLSSGQIDAFLRGHNINFQ